MGLAESAARQYNVRGSTLGGDASMDTLVTQLFSDSDGEDKDLPSHRAACPYWVMSLR